jgi:hypothetical protein
MCRGSKQGLWQLPLILPNPQNSAWISSPFLKVLHNSNWSLLPLDCAAPVDLEFNHVLHHIIHVYHVQCLAYKIRKSFAISTLVPVYFLVSRTLPGSKAWSKMQTGSWGGCCRLFTQYSLSSLEPWPAKNHFPTLVTMWQGADQWDISEKGWAGLPGKGSERACGWLSSYVFCLQEHRQDAGGGGVGRMGATVWLWDIHTLPPLGFLFHNKKKCLTWLSGYQSSVQLYAAKPSPTL